MQCPALRRIYWTSRQTPEAYVLDILYGMTEAEEQARGKFTTLEEAMESRSGGAFFSLLLRGLVRKPDHQKAGPPLITQTGRSEEKSVATNYRAAKFKAVKPTKPRARAGRFKKGIGVAGFFHASS